MKARYRQGPGTSPGSRGTRRHFEAIGYCLTKKGVTLPAGGFGGRGPGYGGSDGGGAANETPATLDAKMWKAMQGCRGVSVRDHHDDQEVTRSRIGSSVGRGAGPCSSSGRLSTGANG